jgi:4'-phosphopantetheinyl transferase
MPGARDFAVGALQCRWQAMPAGVRAQNIADQWLRGIAGDIAADGLHRDARGRPRLAHGDISWSHSHGRLLIGYGTCGRLGIDAESRTRHANPLRIARRFFAAEEIAALEALDGDARQSAFLRMWCGKEAVLKADGRGIALGLEKLVFDASGDGLRMLRCDPALGRVEDWRLYLIAPEPDYIAVLASTD